MNTNYKANSSYIKEIMLKKNANKYNCSGCEACYNICNQRAIKMKADSKGFIYPEIDESKCISCGLCEMVCPLKEENKDSVFNEPIEVYAAKNKKNSIIMESSSGGIFYELAAFVINNNGIVYGAAFDSNFEVIHERINKKEDIFKCMGSKYVQSKIDITYQKIKGDLNKGKYVLFSGTPCQASGLLKYIGELNTDNLYVCDIICHGVPSPKLFNDYRHFLENKYNSKINSFTFRYKPAGWKQTIKVKFENERKYIMSRDYDPYYRLFLKNYALRPSCSKCNYANFNRPSDITLGDYWGIKKVLPEFYDPRGNSVILINSKKGQFLFNRIKNNFELMLSNSDDCVQPNLQRPSLFPDNYNDFWNDYEKEGFLYVCKKYGEYTLKNRIKAKIKPLLIKLGILNR